MSNLPKAKNPQLTGLSKNSWTKIIFEQTQKHTGNYAAQVNNKDKRLAIIHYPIYDISGKLLLQSSQEISQLLIEKITKKSIIVSQKIELSHTAIISDLAAGMNSEDYKIMFANLQDYQEIIKIAANTKIAHTLVEELNKMKETFFSNYTHILMVTALAIKITLDLKTKKLDPYKIAKIGLTHDIGKSRLPHDILEKKGPLTNEEFKIIQTHPIIDYLLSSYYLRNAKSLTANTSLSHHERLDGSGYPRGIRRLNNYVQIIIPCDIFDALISHRPYRSSPYTKRAALDLLLDEVKKGKLSRKFVYCLIRYARKDKPDIRSIKIAKQGRDKPPEINYYGIRAN